MTTLQAVEVPPKIENALARASKVTGTNFDYLVQTALRESSFDKDAKANRSTATGLFQFIESTWLKTLKEEGNRLGLNNVAAQISKNSFGNYVVSNPVTKAKILDLRKDPEISAMVASAYAQKNENYIESKIGRKPTSGEVYIAHFLGARDAAKLIQLVQMQPNAKAGKYFAAAAAKNANMFYDNGRSKTVAEVYDDLVQGYAGTIKQNQASTEIDSEGGWNTVVNRGGQTVNPLLQRGKIRAAENQAAGAGSIGAWANIVGNQETGSGADEAVRSGLGRLTDIYTRK